MKLPPKTPYRYREKMGECSIYDLWVRKSFIGHDIKSISHFLIFLKKGRWGGWDGHVLTVMFEMDKQNGPAEQRTELCSIPRGSLDGTGIWGQNVCVCVWLSPSPQCKIKSVFGVFFPKERVN